MIDSCKRDTDWEEINDFQVSVKKLGNWVFCIFADLNVAKLCCVGEDQTASCRGRGCNILVHVVRLVPAIRFFVRAW